MKASQSSLDNELSIKYLNKLPSNDYIIGPGDRLKIIISRTIKLSSDAIVDGEGTINLPKLERIYVSGLTINELNSLLNEAYQEFLKFPEVETIITRYRPIKVFVNGEVENPGLKVLDGSLSIGVANKSENNMDIFTQNKIESKSNNTSFFPTVFDAIRASGGITQFTDLKNIQIIRKDSISNGSGKITTTLNFEDLLIFGDISQNIRIYDSDIIVLSKSNEPNKAILTKAILSDLNPKFINVFVSGRVKSPGQQILSRASVLSDAIDMAGGAKILRGKVTFIRFQADGSIDKRKIRLTKNKRGKFVNPNLRNGDVIIVGENFFTASTEVIEGFTAPFTSFFSTYAFIKAVSD